MFVVSLNKNFFFAMNI